MFKSCNFLLLLLFILLSETIKANAQSLSAVDVHSCKKMMDTHKPFILALTRGQPLVSSIAQCIHDAHLPSAAMVGLGMVTDPRVGYFDTKTMQYQFKNFSGTYELLSLVGNITQLHGRYFPHIHITIGDKNCHVFGGHLDNAIVGVKTEITIFPFNTAIISKEDALHQFKMIDTKR